MRNSCNYCKRIKVTVVSFATSISQINTACMIIFKICMLSALICLLISSTSNGKVYVAQVKRRSDARKIYDTAKKQGKTAGLVATKSVQNLFNTFSTGTCFWQNPSVQASTKNCNRLCFIYFSGLARQTCCLQNERVNKNPYSFSYTVADVLNNKSFLLNHH